MLPHPRTLTDHQHREVLRLRGAGYDFKTIARITRLTPEQARNAWYRLPRGRREELSQLPSLAEQYREEALQRAKAALRQEIALARRERHTAPPFKVSPLLW